MDAGHLIGSVFGAQSPGSLVTGFVECLLLLLAVDAVRSGRRIYAIASVGLSVTIYARMAEGFIDPAADTLLKAAGLVVAALVLAFDLVFEPVEVP
jgi:hypothetical protein